MLINVGPMGDGSLRPMDTFELPEEIESVTWMDNGADVTFVKEGNKISVLTEPCVYGRSLVVRVANWYGKILAFWPFI